MNDLFVSHVDMKGSSELEVTCHIIHTVYLVSHSSI